jgi:hypothetical protein
MSSIFMTELKEKQHPATPGVERLGVADEITILLPFLWGLLGVWQFRYASVNAMNVRIINEAVIIIRCRIPV